MPSQNRAQIDKLLTNVSIMKKSKGHISELLLPSLKVKQYTGKIGKYGQNHLRIVNTVKRGRGKYREIEAVVRTDTSYEVEGHGLEGMVTKEDYANVEAPFDAESDETNHISSILLQEKEYALASALSDTAVITQYTTLVGGDQFSDYNNSDPIAAFAVAREAVRAGCGMYPDTAFFDKAVWNKIRFHPQLLDALGFKDNRPGGLQNSELATAMGVDRVIVSEAIYQSANEGQTAAALAPIWGKHVWFGVLPESAQKEQTGLGYRIELAGQGPRKVYKWAINNPAGATAILVEDEYDQVLTDVGAVYMIKDAIA